MISQAVLAFLFVTIGVWSADECSFRSENSETGYNASWVYDAQQKRVQFNIEYKPRLGDNFWTGIGFGRTMKGGDMIIVTSNGGRLNVTDRHGTGYAEPAIDAKQDVQEFTGRLENNVLRVSFSRLVDTKDQTEDKPLEEAALNNCQYFIFPVSGGSTAGDPTSSKVVLEQHVNTPTTKLICNISKCTANANVNSPQGQQPAASGSGSPPSNNVNAEEPARDAPASTNRSQFTPRPAIGHTTPAVNPAGNPTPRPAVVANPQSGSNSPINPSGASGAESTQNGADSTCEYSDGRYKVQWYYTETTKRVTFNLNVPLASGRWTGLGFGQQMQGGDMIVIQENNGSPKATDRHGTAHIEPQIDARQDIENFKGSVSNGILQASFNRQLTTGDKDDLPIDDPAQNDCQYFIFPVSGGSVDDEGKLVAHDSTPKVKLICKAKQCKKPADNGQSSGQQPQSNGQPSSGQPSGGQEEETSASPIAGSEPGTTNAGLGPIGGGRGQPAVTVSPPGIGGIGQPQPTSTTPALGQNPGGLATTNQSGQSRNQPTGGQQIGQQGSTSGQGGSGSEGGEAGGASTQGQGAAGTEVSAGGATRPCPARQDHSACRTYIDDYLSVVYSRFPKTDVITQKACTLLATHQEGVVLRECCHYLANQCGRFIDQYIGGISSISASNNANSQFAATSAVPQLNGGRNGPNSTPDQSNPNVPQQSTPPNSNFNAPNPNVGTPNRGQPLGTPQDIQSAQNGPHANAPNPVINGGVQPANNGPIKTQQPADIGGKSAASGQRPN